MVSILVVDDDIADVELLRSHFQRARLPYELTIASSVEDAIDILRASRFDLALVDYRLPDGVGTDIISHANRAPVVIITGFGDEAVVLTALRAGAYDYLIKDSDNRYVTLIPATIDRVLARRRTELDAIRREAELENARARMAELDRFAGIIANAISIPLSITAHWSRLIQSSTTDRMLVTYANAASKSSERAQKFVSDLLDYARIATEPPTTIELQHAIDCAIEVVFKSTPEVDIRIPRPLPQASGDPALATQLFLVLLQNSLDYCRPDNALIIDIEWTQTEHGVTVKISDNGRSIARENIDKVTDPYFRERNDDIPPEAHSGMGLTKARKIVALLGGKLWFETTSPQGTTACASFPAPIGAKVEPNAV